MTSCVAEFRAITFASCTMASIPTISRLIRRCDHQLHCSSTSADFAELRNENATLEIAGTGDYRPALEALTREMGIESRVRFLGFIPEESKLALLRRAWAATLASPKEGWGISNMEAAACGTPVVASDSPGIRESVIHEETGFLVPHADIAAMADAMRKLADSPSLVESMGKAGRRFAEGFSWEKSADDTIAHLEEVVMRRGESDQWK